MAAAVFCAHPSLAQEDIAHEPIYRAWLEAGALFSQSTDLHSFPGAGGASKLELDSGFRVGLGSTYQFKPYFALDWEIGVLGSSVDKASGLEEFDATITQVPFLVSGTFQYQNETGITPFVGAGIGVSSTTINVDEARSSTTTVSGSDYDFVFAWQLAGGVKYDFKNGMAVGVVYKYLWTGDVEWELEQDSPGTADQELELDGIRSHGIMGYISYRF
jgi:opacity protein-like surface antigen